MEERKTDYVVLTVRKGGTGNQRYKQLKETAETLQIARRIAKRLSQQFHYSSAVIMDGSTNKPIEFWNSGELAESH